MAGKVEREEEVKASAAAASAAAAGSPDGEKVEAAAAESPDGEKVEAIKKVEMPEHRIRWILEHKVLYVIPDDDDDDLVTLEGLPQKFVDYKRELFSSTRESLRASQAEFLRYQASIREEYERDGRVMVPEDDEPPISDEQRELNRIALQEEIDLLFAQGSEEFAREFPELVELIASVEAMNVTAGAADAGEEEEETHTV